MSKTLSFICEGWCSLVYEIDKGGPPEQITNFEGTWVEAHKLGWRFTTDSKWARDKKLVILCPECSKREGIE